jgi:hypothetical protein
LSSARKRRAPRSCRSASGTPSVMLASIGFSGTPDQAHAHA